MRAPLSPPSHGSALRSLVFRFSIGITRIISKCYESDCTCFPSPRFEPFQCVGSQRLYLWIFPPHSLRNELADQCLALTTRRIACRSMPEGSHDPDSRAQDPLKRNAALIFLHSFPHHLPAIQPLDFLLSFALSLALHLNQDFKFRKICATQSIQLPLSCNSTRVSGHHAWRRDQYSRLDQVPSGVQWPSSLMTGPSKLHFLLWHGTIVPSSSDVSSPQYMDQVQSPQDFRGFKIRGCKSIKRLLVVQNTHPRKTFAV